MNIVYVGNKLSSHGYSVTGVETLGKQLESIGYNVVSTSDKKSQLLRVADMLYTVIKYRRKTDVLLIDTYSKVAFWYALIISMFAIFTKLKYIPILRGGNLPSRLEGNKVMSNIIFKNSFRNISPSKYLMNEFDKKGFEAEYIPNNIDVSNYQFRQREKCVPKLLYVRSFDLIYNPQMAIHVLQKVVAKYPEAELCMVGPDKDGSMQDCKNLVAEFGLQEKVVFTGKLSKAEWHTLADEYSIFINTTNFDNMPVSVMEAMALGIPVISTNVGGIPFLLDHNETALLVDKGDTEAMVKSICHLIENPTVAETLSKTGRHYIEGFDWEVIKHRWQDLLALPQ